MAAPPVLRVHCQVHQVQLIGHAPAHRPAHRLAALVRHKHHGPLSRQLGLQMRAGCIANVTNVTGSVFGARGLILRIKAPCGVAGMNKCSYSSRVLGQKANYGWGHVWQEQICVLKAQMIVDGAFEDLVKLVFYLV